MSTSPRPPHDAPTAGSAPTPFSFVIPVRNGERFMAGCLAHIAAQSRPGDEVIVVDNGSTDGTRAVAAAAGATVLEAPGVTIAALRNLGAAKARHDVLAFVDADCLLCDGWRANAERVLGDPGVAAVGSFYDLPEHPTWVERAWWSFRPTHEHRTRFIISGNLVVRRTAFEAVHGFDVALVTDEDSDFSRRLVDAGATLVEAPSVRSIHLGNAKTIRQFYAKERWHATSVVATMRAHGIDRSMWMTFAFIALSIAAVLTLLVRPLGWFSVPLAAALLLAAPAATAAAKVVRDGNYRFLPELILLHTVVFVVRSGVVLRSAFGAPPGR